MFGRSTDLSRINCFHGTSIDLSAAGMAVIFCSIDVDLEDKGEIPLC